MTNRVWFKVSPQPATSVREAVEAVFGKDAPIAHYCEGVMSCTLRHGVAGSVGDVPPDARRGRAFSEDMELRWVADLDGIRAWRTEEVESGDGELAETQERSYFLSEQAIRSGAVDLPGDDAGSPSRPCIVVREYRRAPPGEWSADSVAVNALLAQSMVAGHRFVRLEYRSQEGHKA